MMPQNAVRRRWAVIWPVSLFCLLAGSRWLLEGSHPELASTAAAQAAGCFLIAGLAGCLHFLRARLGGPHEEAPRNLSGISHWRRFGGGALALAGPALGAALSNRHISADNATLALALTPCVIAVANEAFGEEIGESLAARLWPGLAGVTGLLLLLPQPVLAHWRFGLALALMPMLTGVGAVAFGSKRPPRDTAHAGAPPPSLWGALLLAGGVYAAFAVAVSHTGVFSRPPLGAAVLDGFSAFLLVLALQQLGATRWGALFLLTPFLTLLEGVVFLRPVLDLRSWIAFLLLAAGGTYLLVVGRPEPPAKHGFLL